MTGEPFKPEMNPQCGQADGVPEVLKAVREQIAAGVDVIKMYGSTGSDKDVTGYQTFTSEEMKAAVVEALKLDPKLTVKFMSERNSKTPAVAEGLRKAGLPEE